jgi:fumarylpyruvate hydrolase
MQFVFPPPVIPVVPIAGSQEKFPVHRIYCVGRNYAEHAIEMGWTGREPPFFFSKPADAVLPVEEGETGEMPYPPMTSDLHHEIELVAAIGKAGTNIPVHQALDHVWGYAIGLDMTRRDLQADAKKGGRPWSTAKGFDLSAPISQIYPVGMAGHIAQGQIHLDVNGERRQASDVGKLTWSVAEIVAHLSRYFTLQPGDLIFTGTPEGVGPVRRGDILEGGIEGLGALRIRIA